jgi:hypothetical protein
MSDESIYKIRASRVNSISAQQYDGYEGLIWYDTFTGELRIWDNNIPGGRLIYDNGPSTTNKLINGAFEFVLTPTGNVTAPGSILPSANVSYDLGSPTNAWRSLYISGNTLYIANENMSVNPSTGIWNFTSNGANINLGANSTFANIAVNIASANAISVSGNITTQGAVSASGNVTVGNLNALGQVSAVGNVAGNYFIGNGSQLTGLPATYSNAQVATFLASGTDTSNIITTANISGSYFLGNGAFLTGINATTNKIFNGNSYANISAASGNVEINANGQSWLFGTSGNLTLPGNTVSINYANGTPYGGAGSSLPPQTGNVGKILSTNGTSPLWTAMPGVFGLVIDGGSAAYVSTDFIIDGGTAA